MMDDLYTQETSSRRQRLLADLLRKQALASEHEAASGQMISGRYVGPSWAQSLTQGLKPFAAERQALQQESLANTSEARYNQNLNQARQQWQSALPQAVKGTSELQGQMDPSNPAELSAIPGQPVTTGQILKHTLAGMNIPGNEKSAALYNQGALADLTREDNQTARREDQAARLLSEQAIAIRRGQEKLEELKLRLEDSGLSRASREQIAKMMDDTRRDIAQGQRTLERLAIDARIQVANIAADAKKASDTKEKAAIDKDVTNLSKRMGPLNTTINAAQEVQNLLDAYRDPKTGSYKSIPGIGRETALPGWARSVGQQAGALDKATNPNFAVVNRLLGDIMRQQAGLSQTISEQARVIATNLASGSYTQQEFIDNWGALQKAINNDLNNLQAGHSDEVLDQFKERGGKLDPVRSAIADTPSAAEQATARAAGLTKTTKQQRLEELRRKQAGGQ